MAKKKSRESQPIIYLFNSKSMCCSSLLDANFETVIVLKCYLI